MRSWGLNGRGGEERDVENNNGERKGGKDVKLKKEQKRKILFYGILAGALLLFAACAAHLAPYDPYEQNLELSLLPPSAAHWMGTDRYGRDLFSRILSGARISIFSALLVVAASALIGTLAGIFSGWLEGKTDTVLMQISDIFLAFPGMVFAIAFSGVLQSGMTGAVVSLILVSWPKYARLARNRVLALKHMPFIAAARLTGNGTWKMIFPSTFCQYLLWTTDLCRSLW